MDNKIIKKLISDFEIIDIEKELIVQYLQFKRLDFSDSNYINNYLTGHNSSYNLQKLVSLLQIGTIKDLENCLELIMPISDKKLNGAFFTPSYIVDYIIKEIKPKIDDTNIDPSCGCGAFLIGLVEYYKNRYNKSIKSIIVENIYGADILEYNTKRTKLILSIYALQNNEIIEETDFNIYCVDSLKHKWNVTFTNIVGNPPYVKFQDLTDENREYLTNNWQTTQSGAYNLYFAFFELGYKLLGSGKLGYITPNNYFTSLSGESLRAFFSSNKSINKIVDFAAKKVFDVQTYTAITFLSKTTNDKILYDRISQDQMPKDFLSNLSFSSNNIKNLNKKKWRLLRNCERDNIYKIENIGEPIKNIYDICVGIATLKDAVFFIDGNTFDGEFYHKKASNGNIYKIEKNIVKSVYKISDFKFQNDINDNNRKIICPYIVNGTTTLIAEDIFQVKYPQCYKYLLAERDTLESRDKGRKTATPFYAWGRTQGISKYGTKLLTPTFSKVPRFLKVEEEKAYFTNGYGIFFKNNFNLFDVCNPLSKVENIDVVQMILNSAVMNYYITRTSVAIEGGYPCYQKNFIERFSIPTFTDDDITALRNLKSKKEIDCFLISKYNVEIAV
ncbi:MAG: N-6 DNA methylase [Bacteroidales bacterium]